VSHDSDDLHHAILLQMQPLPNRVFIRKELASERGVDHHDGRCSFIVSREKKRPRSSGIDIALR